MWRCWDRRSYGCGSDLACVRVDPKNQDVVYVANTSTYRSIDAGQSFTPIKGAPGGDDYHTIWINPNNPNIILLAVDQGATISVNCGQTWKNVTPPALTPWSKVSHLHASHFDDGTVYATINRFRLDEQRPHIYRTHDGATLSTMGTTGSRCV